MRLEGFDAVRCVSEPGAWPFRLEQHYFRRSRLPALGLLTLIGAAIALPQIGLAAYAIADPVIRHEIAGQPLIAIQWIAALALWTAVLVIPAHRLATASGRRSSIEVSPTVVRVSEEYGRRTESWSEPLASFSGVAHHTRTSLSGMRQELVMVHPNRGRSVIIAAAPLISDSAHEDMARFLSLPRVHPAAIYGFSGPHPRTQSNPDGGIAALDTVAA